MDEATDKTDVWGDSCYHLEADGTACLHVNRETATCCAIAYAMGHYGDSYMNATIDIRRLRDGKTIRTWCDGLPRDVG